MHHSSLGIYGSLTGHRQHKTVFQLFLDQNTATLLHSDAQSGAISHVCLFTSAS